MVTSSFTGEIVTVFNTLYVWQKAIIGASGVLIIGWKLLKAQFTESDDDTGMESKKHIKGVIRVVLWTIGAELASVIFSALVPK